MDDIGDYVAAEHGVTGLAKSLASELGKPQDPGQLGAPETSCNTPMLVNEGEFKIFRPDLEHPTLVEALPSFASASYSERKVVTLRGMEGSIQSAAARLVSRRDAPASSCTVPHL